MTRAQLTAVADFETTTDPDDCRVWAWGTCHVDNPERFRMGGDIKSYVDFVSRESGIVYFHNLKFDGTFLLDYLLKNGYRHSTEEFKSSPGDVKTLISNMGKFFSMTVYWTNGKKTEFRDSLKKLPMSVKALAESYDLGEMKGEIDYHKARPVGYKPTPEEREYIRKDVQIVAKALKIQLDAGMTGLTVASDALAEYKRLIGPKHFSRLFPTFSIGMDSEIRGAYRGGFTYRDPRFGGRVVGPGMVFDVNSLYPHVMASCVLPFSTPTYKPGRVITSDTHPLSVFSVTFTASLKPEHIPCIQLKGSSHFLATEYQKNILEPTTMMVTNVDWELYNEQYNIDVISYNGGWLFNGATGLFDDYVNKWSEVKRGSKGGKREVAKLYLNSLYGKFATNPNVTGKVPVIEDDRVRYVTGDPAERAPVYTPMGVFITAYARAITVRAAQENYDVFAYADTDSLHLLCDTAPANLDIHPTRFGAWKYEYSFDRAFYVRAKAYLEQTSSGYVNRVAGLPVDVSASLTMDDAVRLMESGELILAGKLQPKNVPGGVVLMDIDYTLTP